MVEVHSLLYFDACDIPCGTPPDQCLDEFDNFIMKQENFNKHVQSQLHYNSIAIKNLHDVLEKIANDVRGLVKNFHMVQTQLEQITKVQIVFLANMSNPAERKTYGIQTRGGTLTQDPLYHEGHPKRIEQDSQLIENDDPSSSKKKKKKHKRTEEPKYY